MTLEYGPCPSGGHVPDHDPAGLSLDACARDQATGVGGQVEGPAGPWRLVRFGKDVALVPVGHVVQMN